MLYLGLYHSRQYFQKLVPALSLDTLSCFYLFLHATRPFWKRNLTAHKSGSKRSAFSLLPSTGITCHHISTRKGVRQDRKGERTVKARRWSFSLKNLNHSHHNKNCQKCILVNAIILYKELLE